jgi:hypothetical protein
MLSVVHLPIEGEARLIKFIQCTVVMTFMSFISACASMVDSMDKAIGIGQVSVEQETLDDSTTVRLSPAFLTDDVSDYGLNSYKLGARWNSQSPDTVYLEPNYDSQAGGNAYTRFEGITVRLDGHSERFDSVGRTNLSSSDYNSVSNTIYTESTGLVPVPLNVVEQMVSVEDVRLRIHSSDGYEDSIFSLARADSGQGLALKYFQNFLSAVKQQSEK